MWQEHQWHTLLHFFCYYFVLTAFWCLLSSTTVVKDPRRHGICLLIGSFLKSTEIPPTFNFEFVIITWYIIFQIKVHKSYFNAPLISNLNLPVTVSVGGIVLGPIWRAYHTRCCSEGLCWETSLFFRKREKMLQIKLNNHYSSYVILGLFVLTYSE